MSVSVQYTLITPPNSEPVSVDDLKTYFQISDDASDDLIERVGKAARETIEIVLRRQLMTATWRCFYDTFPGQRVSDISTAGGSSLNLNTARPQLWFDIPKPPLQEVTVIEYLDPETAEWIELDEAVYRTRTECEPGRIELAYGQQWPQVLPQAGSVRIEFVAGYGGADNIPASIVTAICALAKNLFDVPGPVIMSGSQPATMPLHLNYLLDAVRWHGWE